MLSIKAVNIEDACMDLGVQEKTFSSPSSIIGSCMFQQVKNEYRFLSRINTVVGEHGSTIVRVGTLLPSLGLIALKVFTCSECTIG